MVADLILRYLWLHGSATLGRLNETLKLSFPVLETLFHQFRNQQLLEVKGMTGNDYSFTLTASGARGPLFVEGEEVERVRVSATAGATSRVSYITKSGREVALTKAR